MQKQQAPGTETVFNVQNSQHMSLLRSVFSIFLWSITV